MSTFLTGFFRSSSPQRARATDFDKRLPKDFAQQILDNDIVFVLSSHTNKDAMKNLVSLYMQGVEYFKEIQDQAYQYFQIKLHHIMDTSVPLKEETKTYEQLQQQQLQQQQFSIKQEGTPKKKKAFEIPKLQVSNNPVTKPFQSMRPIRDQSNQFSFTENPPNSGLKEETTAKHKFSKDSDDNCGQALPSEPDERKEDMILIVKSEVFQLDEQKQAKEMLNDFTSQQQAISQIINTDMDHQAIQIANRLKRRSTQHQQPLSKANSQPLLNPVENDKSEVCQRIQEDPNENISSSKLPSVQKQNDSHFQFNLEEQPNSPQKR